MNNIFTYPTSAQYLTNCMLNVTDDCNLECKYCFVEQQPHYMTLDTAKAAADWLYQNFEKKKRLGILSENEKIRFYFFGGEPMLCYDSIIVPIIEYIENKYPNIFYYGMTTNGTLLNEGRINFLKSKNFELLLSIDGNPTTQNYNRPCKNHIKNSSDLVEKNIPYLLEKFPYLCFRSTIYAPTVEHLFDNYLYAESLGFRNWDAIIDSRHDWTTQQIEVLKEQMSKIYQYRLSQLINNQSIMESSHIEEWFGAIINLYKDKNSYNIKNHSSIWRCGLGTNIGSIGWDGSIYGCQEQTSRGCDSIFYIGNIFTGGIDIIKHNKLLSLYYKNQIEQKIKKDECNNCELLPVCKINFLGCPSTYYDLFQNMNDLPEVECQLRKIYLYNSLLILKIIFSLNNQEIINRFLDILQIERSNPNG